MKTQQLAIVDGVRTPFIKAGTDFAALGAEELGRVAVNALLTRTGLDPALVDEVIFGCVAQPADAANVARVIALRAGIPESVPALTVHRNCASGMEAVTQAYEHMMAGRGEVFIVGGAESMSQVPLMYPQSAAEKFTRLSKAKTLPQKLQAMAGFRPKDFSPRVGLLLGLTDPVCGLNMGQTAEVLARELGISREEQDAFAIESHRKALAATERLQEEITPVYLPGKDPVVKDNGPRADQSPEVLAKLRPIFERGTGTVTAGNSSQVTDGAVALLVMSGEMAEELGYKPLGYLKAYAYSGCDPERMGLGPVFAMDRLEELTGLEIEQADLLEVNEAFAAQVLGVLRAAKSEKFSRKVLGRRTPLGEVTMDKLNVNGGSIALGHPVGATGARLILTALKELERRQGARALVSLCVGGGQGGAVWLERSV
ncbi:MAG: 3-ketoacyl-CoA thiolase [Verrucomicrobia bacterium]|jgi:acetyl-CoA C-acetyltransferase/acetyl-CoA acyltransferase|nr:3-ketoacyl-CoA thiolase [Verrucomicrobiota bacterium]